MSENQKAVLKLVVLLLPALIVWLSAGFPTDRAALGLLLANILTVIMNFANDILGIRRMKREAKEKC